MSVPDFLVKMFDPYSRVARLYPSLIALAPIAWSAIALFPNIVDTVGHSAIFAISATCILYFITGIARSRGKVVERKLLKRWDGWPSTTLLRHRDATIDPVTKARYHTALSSLCGGLAFSSPQHEAANPSAADDVYRSATKKLIEQRRGPQYKLLHGENASYGFRRNLYGLKPLVLTETLIMAVLTGGAWWLVTPQPYTRLIVAEFVVQYPHFPVLLALDLAFGLIWIWAVVPNFVLQSGRDYAEALLRTLDS